MMITGSLIRQYVVVVMVNLCSLSTGIGIGWSSPGLVKLSDKNQTTLSRPITLDEGSSIVSFSCITTVIAVFASAFLMDVIGRKTSIILTAGLKVVLCVTQTLATEVWVVILTRALLGGLDSVLFCVVPAYATEVASTEIRGALGVIHNVLIALGIVIILTVGPFCSFMTMNILDTAVIAISMVPLPFIPESPYFLYSKGRQEESAKVLKLLRGSEILVNEEIKQYFIIRNTKNVNRWLLFKDRIFLKSLGLSLVFYISGQLTGHGLVMAYLQSILEKMNISIKPEIASIVIGCVVMVASICTFFFMDKFGRKPILAVTLSGAALGLFGLGIFFKLHESGYDTKGYISYLPILSLILFLFCQGFGFSTLSIILISELFDGPSRATGISSVIVTAALVLFFTAQYFVTLVILIGFSTLFWIFSIIALMTCLFVIFCLPETKGKTFLEIQIDLGAKKCDDVK